MNNSVSTCDTLQWLYQYREGRTIRTFADRLFMSEDHVWDPYNAFAKRSLYCHLLTSLEEVYMEDGSMGPPPRIVSRKTIGDLHIEGTVILKGDGGIVRCLDPEYSRVWAGVVRECGYQFGMCLLHLSDSVYCAFLLYPGERAPEPREEWSYRNHPERDWNIIAGPCARIACSHLA